MVHLKGLEPPSLAAQEPESCVFASFTTGAAGASPKNFLHYAKISAFRQYGMKTVW